MAKLHIIDKNGIGYDVSGGGGGGSGVTQDLDQVLDQGNTSDKEIILAGNRGQLTLSNEEVHCQNDDGSVFSVWDDAGTYISEGFMTPQYKEAHYRIDGINVHDTDTTANRDCSLKASPHEFLVSSSDTSATPADSSFKLDLTTPGAAYAMMSADLVASFKSILGIGGGANLDGYLNGAYLNNQAVGHEKTILTDVKPTAQGQLSFYYQDIREGAASHQLYLNQIAFTGLGGITIGGGSNNDITISGASFVQNSNVSHNLTDTSTSNVLGADQGPILVQMINNLSNQDADRGNVVNAFTPELGWVIDQMVLTSQGSGYAVGDVLYPTLSLPSADVVLKAWAIVGSVDAGGAIQTLSVSSKGFYLTNVAANGVATSTTGSGTGAVVDLMEAHEPASTLHDYPEPSLHSGDRAHVLRDETDGNQGWVYSWADRNGDGIYNWIPLFRENNGQLVGDGSSILVDDGVISVEPNLLTNYAKKNVAQTITGEWSWLNTNVNMNNANNIWIKSSQSICTGSSSTDEKVPASRYDVFLTAQKTQTDLEDYIDNGGYLKAGSNATITGDWTFNGSTYFDPAPNGEFSTTSFWANPLYVRSTGELGVVNTIQAAFNAKIGAHAPSVTFLAMTNVAQNASALVQIPGSGFTIDVRRGSGAGSGTVWIKTNSAVDSYRFFAHHWYGEGATQHINRTITSNTDTLYQIPGALFWYGGSDRLELDLVSPHTTRKKVHVEIDFYVKSDNAAETHYAYIMMEVYPNPVSA